MNRTTLALGLMAGSILGAGSASAGELHDQVNKFNGIRTVEWRTIPSQPDEFAFSSAIGIPEGKNARFYSGGLTTYGKVKFNSCNHTYWLLDGRRAPEIQTKYRLSHTSSTAIESFDLTDPGPMLRAIAAAKQVEYQVCNIEGVVSPEDLEGLRKVLQHDNQ